MKRLNTLYCLFAATLLAPSVSAQRPGTGTGLDGWQAPAPAPVAPPGPTAAEKDAAKKAAAQTAADNARKNAELEQAKEEARRAKAEEKRARDEAANVKKINDALAAQLKKAQEDALKAAPNPPAVDAARPLAANPAAPAQTRANPFLERPAFPGGPTMVELPAAPGGFMMGSKDYDDEKDSRGGPHRVNIAYVMEMGQTEVTVAQYLQCVAEAGACDEPHWRLPGQYHYQTGTDNFWKKFGAALAANNAPIVGVSWHNARQYAAWVSKKAGLGSLPADDPRRYRLPTEAEWEYAARANTGDKWSGTNDETKLQRYAWYNVNSDSKMHDVRGKLPNDFRLFDMTGNVWEWTQDCYVNNYNQAPTNGAAVGSATDKDCARVVRGGSWIVSPVFLRSAIRNRLAPGVHDYGVGFRLARTLF